MLYVFFWVIPRRSNFICRRFGTLCLFHLHRQVGVKWLHLRIVGVSIREKVGSSETFSRMDTQTILKCSHFTPTYLWRWNRQSVPKRRHTKFKRSGNYPEENIQHTGHGESLKSKVKLYFQPYLTRNTKITNRYYRTYCTWNYVWNLQLRRLNPVFLPY